MVMLGRTVADLAAHCICFSLILTRMIYHLFFQQFRDHPKSMSVGGSFINVIDPEGLNLKAEVR